jgi:hypothetical protein
MVKHFYICFNGESLWKSLKGAAARFSWEDRRKFSVRNITILPKLRVFINYSHQIAFEMEKNEWEKLYIGTNLPCLLKHGTEQKTE